MEKAETCRNIFSVSAIRMVVFFSHIKKMIQYTEMGNFYISHKMETL